LIAIDLAASFPQWVRRRKTTYRFVDESTVTLRQSIDLVLPDADWFADPPQLRDTIYIPLHILRKETLTGFSVTDREGLPVSVLNTHENATLVTEGFGALINPDAPGAAALRAVVLAETPVAGSERLEDLPEGLVPGGQYQALLHDLAVGFLVLVPVSYEADANHIFKLEWSATYGWAQRGFGGGLRSVAASFGLADKVLEFPDLPVGFAHGTHFEFDAPEGVRNLETKLEPVEDDGEVEGQPSHRRIAYAKPQANVNISIRDPTNVVACRSDLAKVTLRLRPRRGGTFLAIVVVAWLTVALLATIAARLSHLDVQTGSAVVLVLPAVLAAFLAREGEHAIAGRLRMGVRVCGLLIAALAFGAAILIGVGELRESAPAVAQRLRCSATNDVAGRRVALQRLDCNTVPALEPEAHASPGVQTTVWVLCVVAGSIALVLSVGLWSTSHASRRATRLAEHSNPAA